LKIKTLEKKFLNIVFNCKFFRNGALELEKKSKTKQALFKRAFVFLLTYLCQALIGFVKQFSFFSVVPPKNFFFALVTKKRRKKHAPNVVFPSEDQ